MDNDDYLIHYGVLGMKWGVRKDRNNVNKNVRKQRQKSMKKSMKKAARKATNVVSVIGMYYVADLFLNGGVGVRAVGEVAKTTGRAAVSAVMKAKGHTDIRWL